MYTEKGNIKTCFCSGSDPCWSLLCRTSEVLVKEPNLCEIIQYETVLKSLN